MFKPEDHNDLERAKSLIDGILVRRTLDLDGPILSLLNSAQQTITTAERYIDYKAALSAKGTS